MRQPHRTRTVLLLDDNADLLKHYKRELERTGMYHVTNATEGQRALQMAHNQLFDAVVIDAKLDFKGLEFGGLRLAEDLRPRYGTSSIVVVSRFITRDLMNSHGAECEFLEKNNGTSGRSFGDELRRLLSKLCKKQFVFVAMPFDAKYLGMYRQIIKPAIRDAGLGCVRVDELTHTRRIHDVIFDGVVRSKLVLFVADGASPNAYYEAGFADAMKKEVVIIAREIEELRFDVQTRHTITYGKDITKLRSAITAKLIALRRTGL